MNCTNTSSFTVHVLHLLRTYLALRGWEIDPKEGASGATVHGLGLSTWHLNCHDYAGSLGPLRILNRIFCIVNLVLHPK
jgi:hypothetical protein